MGHYQKGVRLCPLPTRPFAGISKIKLSVVKGLRVGKNYALKEGVTYLGRKGPHAVDVDLTEQENPGPRGWSIALL